MGSQLIYDVGVNDGTDAAYYMHRNYKVIGIEANPTMISFLHHKFKDEIDRGILTLLDVGIAESEGEFEFWVCDDNPEWSSFNRSISSRNGAKHHSVTVRTRPFRDIVIEYGKPFYCKIDIEGNDRVCLESLTPEIAPDYISIEMCESSPVDIGLLDKLGYKKFKIISQVTRAQPARFLTSLEFLLPEKPVIIRKARSFIRKADKRFRGVNRKDDWVFPSGSSGAFAEDTPGQWQTRTEVLSLWHYLRYLDIRTDSGGLKEWYDIHASK
jgi:FkbM family methyltransferase